MEASPLIWSANQWTDFYMIKTLVMDELNYEKSSKLSMNNKHLKLV